MFEIGIGAVENTGVKQIVAEVAVVDIAVVLIVVGVESEEYIEIVVVEAAAIVGFSLLVHFLLVASFSCSAYSTRS